MYCFGPDGEPTICNEYASGLRSESIILDLREMNFTDLTFNYAMKETIKILINAFPGETSILNEIDISYL